MLRQPTHMENGFFKLGGEAYLWFTRIVKRQSAERQSCNRRQTERKRKHGFEDEAYLEFRCISKIRQ